MAEIRVQSVSDPFRSPRQVQQALEAIRLAEAMGLLEEDESIDRLDGGTMHRIGRAASEAGIGRDLLVFFDEAAAAADPEEFARALEMLRLALEESPRPQSELRTLLGVFPLEQLAELVGSSVASLRRYAAGSRVPPDDLAERVHFIAMIVGDLRGAYNDLGIRRWFERRRSALRGRSPAQLLTGDWSPEHRGPAKVRQLARSLAGMGAT